MVLEGECDGLLQKGVEPETCSRLKLVGQMWLCYDLACTPYQLVLVPCINLEQPKDLIWHAAGFAFCHFGKFQILHMGSGFLIWHVLTCKLTFKHTRIPYAMCLGTIGIRLKWFEDWVNAFSKSGWCDLILYIMMNVHV